jgi:hypothetical protein
MDRKELYRWAAGVVLAFVLAIASRYGIKPEVPVLPPITIQADNGMLIKAIPVQ